MSVKITIVVGNQSIPAELNDSKTAELVYSELPFESGFSVWGDEIYFPIPVETGPENSKDIVEIGDIAYWPPGKSLCIFYGATPGSTEEEIRPASPVNPLGRIQGDARVLKGLVETSHTIRIEKA